MALEVFKKLPLGGLDRRALAASLAANGKSTASELLAKQRTTVRARETRLAKDSAVVVLGGSNGITRALAIQLLFGGSGEPSKTCVSTISLPTTTYWARSMPIEIRRCRARTPSATRSTTRS